jgi:glycosyltransferase involved in cell wall biosynthesis
MTRNAGRFETIHAGLRRRLRRLEDRRRRQLTRWRDAHEAKGGRPRIVLLADLPRWAFNSVATSIARRLRDRFDVRVRYVVDRPHLDPSKIDLLYVFYWKETYHRRFVFPPERVIREVASYRWMDERHGTLSPEELVSEHLSDSRTLTTPCRDLFEKLSRLHPNVHLCPNGVEFDRFRIRGERTGPLRIGWVGNPLDISKGLHDILIPATEGRFDFAATSGEWSQSKVARFYSKIDVLAIASLRESQPLPLMEAMASGCFIVTTDVGIVREMREISDGGIMVVERNTEAFGEAFEACRANLLEIRSRGRKNAEVIRRVRDWDVLAGRFDSLFCEVLAGLGMGVG